MRERAPSLVPRVGKCATCSGRTLRVRLGIAVEELLCEEVERLVAVSDFPRTVEYCCRPLLPLVRNCHSEMFGQPRDLAVVPADQDDFSGVGRSGGDLIGQAGILVVGI